MRPPRPSLEACLAVALLAFGPSCLGEGSFELSDPGGAREDEGSTEDLAPGDTAPEGLSDTTAEDDTPAAPSGRFGIVCGGDFDCAGGVCAEGPDGYMCTVPCDDDCPAGWTCRIWEDADLGRFAACLPLGATTCLPCSSQADCGGANYCVSAGVGTPGYCASPCLGLGKPCPGGFLCTEAAVAGHDGLRWVCALAEAGQCCAAATAGIARPCETWGDYFACQGHEVCEGTTGWGACDAREPSEETCNGIDDDCNGEVDDIAEFFCSCGDGECRESENENMFSCPCDCATCGDGICSACGESPSSCPQDCCPSPEWSVFCGDGYCMGPSCGEDPESCPEDCKLGCGNGTCDERETPRSCPDDCPAGTCGNGACEPEDGGPGSCPEDCSEDCGDCACAHMNPEHFLNCPIDCGHCGDGVCSPCPELAETGETCPEDCCTPEPRERCNGMDDTCDGVVDEGFEVGRLCNTHPGGLCMRGVTACVSPTEVGCVDDGPKLCDDGDACTLDSCDKLTGACLHEPGGVEGLACDDGDACSRRDVCRGGVCTGEDPVSCAPSDQCHDTGECDPQTGTCSDPARPEDHPCDDGDACTRSDGCRSGVCVGSDLLECPPPDQCYAEGMCDPSTGLCVDRVKETGAPCDDGNACTRSDECTSGVCVGGDPKPCPAPDECHLEGSCDPTSGECSNPQAIDGTPCGDGKACQGGVCTRGQ